MDRLMPLVSVCRWPCCSELLLGERLNGKDPSSGLDCPLGLVALDPGAGSCLTRRQAASVAARTGVFCLRRFSSHGAQVRRARTLGWQAVVVSSFESSHVLKMLREAWPFVGIRQQIASLGGA